MHTAASQGLRDEYQASGVALVDTLVPNDEISRIRGWLADVAGLAPDIPSTFDPEWETAGSERTAIRKLRRLFWNDPEFWRDTLLRTGIVELARIMVGTPVALTFHAAFLKSAKVGSPVAFHQDQSLWRYEYPQAVSIWIALTDATRKNGCLMGCRRSHLRGLLPHSPVPDHPWHEGVDWRRENLCEPDHYELKPGDALVWNRYFVHGSSSNASDESRWGIVLVFVDRTLPGLQTTDRVDF